MEWWGDYGWAVWLATALGLGVLEMLSLELVLVMLAVGATVGMVAALLGAPVILQALLAAGGAVAMLAVVRPKLAQRLHGGPELLLGPRKLIGMQTVAEEAFDTHHPGTIKIDGERWTAQPYDESVRVEAGQTVQVLQIKGATAYVHPLPSLED